MTYLPFISILVSVLGLAALYFGFVVKIASTLAAIQSTCVSRAKATECLPELQHDVAVLTAANDVWWKVLGPSLGGIIHSPIHKRRDQLMDEWLDAKGEVPEADLRELRAELEQMLIEADGGNAKSLRLAGALILSRVEAQIDALERAPFQNGGI